MCVNQRNVGREVESPKRAWECTFCIVTIASPARGLGCEICQGSLRRMICCRCGNLNYRGSIKLNLCTDMNTFSLSPPGSEHQLREQLSRCTRPRSASSFIRNPADSREQYRRHPRHPSHWPCGQRFTTWLGDLLRLLGAGESNASRWRSALVSPRIAACSHDTGD